MNATPTPNDGGSERPRTNAELADRFRAYGYQPEQVPDGDQGQLLLGLLDVYERVGLLRDGRPAALCAICRHATDCWAHAPPEALRQPAGPFG